MAHTNGIESVWAVLKRGYNGVYHHMGTKHISRYVDEFTFRLNQGIVKVHTMSRIASIVGGMLGKRLTYRNLTGI
uniref:ISXO2-like transposase domain-containing protein n=1 Tax=Candidatus Kentrum sp. SD TaxID=2126332 RepID=A0A450Z404_9GAMM|nr:MAG: ISXO2-like transposase domain-containing protein [Candidatus Kentron sp. SD]VFK48524.1 MAG: ISXO2-like transposase domain-containing protein [Candidatus Kentron sp. SD]